MILELTSSYIKKIKMQAIHQYSDFCLETKRARESEREKHRKREKEEKEREGERESILLLSKKYIIHNTETCSLI